MKLLTLCVLLISQPLKAQWQIIHKSSNIDSTWLANRKVRISTDNPITLIERRGELSQYLVVRFAHSKRQLIAVKDIWGFTDSTNAVWRYYNGDMCKVVDYNSVGVKYSIYRTYSRLRSSQPEAYYIPGYSRTLDSKIEMTWEKAMEDIPLGHIIRRKKS